jgi:hypothetical protein
MYDLNWIWQCVILAVKMWIGTSILVFPLILISYGFFRWVIYIEKKAKEEEEQKINYVE